MRARCAVVMWAALTSAGSAQVVTNGTPSGAQPYSGNGSPVQKLLIDGYDIRAGFSDNNGGAYMVLQKATSAYLCHSSPNQTCEKLN